MGRLILSLNHKEFIKADINGSEVDIYHLISNGDVSLVGIIGASPSLFIGSYRDENFKISVVNSKTPLYLGLSNGFHFKIYRNANFKRNSCASFAIKLPKQYGITRNSVGSDREKMWNYVDNNLPGIPKLIRSLGVGSSSSFHPNLYK